MLSHHCVAALVIDGTKILLGLRGADRAFYPGVWDVFGGHVEHGEDELAALVRELREELGIEPVEPAWLATLPLANGLGVCSYYLLRRWRGEMVNRQPREHDRIAWVDEAGLAALTLAESFYPTMFAAVMRDGRFSLTGVE
ncbi:NUDIX domain-containing protein [Chromobacterium vaccinii]|uniref:8-oxo-dGTP diphosphatase n=1 Tax=Chromobacterium vaccinii TaxID=1108595 RepID=A0ABV0FAP8_9NEIS